MYPAERGRQGLGTTNNTVLKTSRMQFCHSNFSFVAGLLWNFTIRSQNQRMCGTLLVSSPSQNSAWGIRRKNLRDGWESMTVFSCILGLPDFPLVSIWIFPERILPCMWLLGLGTGLLLKELRLISEYCFTLPCLNWNIRKSENRRADPQGNCCDSPKIHFVTQKSNWACNRERNRPCGWLGFLSIFKLCFICWKMIQVHELMETTYWFWW